MDSINKNNVKLRFIVGKKNIAITGKCRHLIPAIDMNEIVLFVMYPYFQVSLCAPLPNNIID